MTKQPQKVNIPPRDRQEIEITSEMIEAGADVLRSYDLGGDLSCDVAQWVFSAMLEAKDIP